MADGLLGFLRGHDAAYCLACLEQAFPSVAVAEELDRAQRVGAPLMAADGRCAICAKTTIVIAWITGDPDLARLVRRIGWS